MSSGHGITSRIIWLVLGPTHLFVCLVFIALTPQTPFSNVLDVIYYGLLVITVIARFVDRPPKHFGKIEEYKAGLISALRYIIILSGSSIMLWAVAHFVVKKII
ncbi:MAG: hypothetical protein V1871_05830 [Planctomycetota bacterium]